MGQLVHISAPSLTHCGRTDFLRLVSIIPVYGPDRIRLLDNYHASNMACLNAIDSAKTLAHLS